MKTKSNLILIKILIDIYCDSSIYSHSQSPSTKGTPFLHQKMEAIGFQHCCTFVSVPKRPNFWFWCQSDSEWPPQDSNSKLRSLLFPSWHHLSK